jgi:hypothetical protein
MDRVTSVVFKVTLMDLKEPVEVTVHGRVIGTWIPAGLDVPSPETESVKVPTQSAARTFTPVPKPTSRR